MGPLDQRKRNANAKHTVIQRRSHTKSRAGCLSCKARRIKCSEEKPICAHCKLKSKICEYPAPRLNPVNLRFGNGWAIPLPGPPCLPVSSVNDEFTLRDLRLFHHFLHHAYPSLPLGNQATWIRDVPQLVYEYEHLMHALLALGASHIGSRTSGNDDTNKDNYSALTHRGRAIAGLKKAFSRNDKSSSESDAMLATCYALAFQSAHLSNGALDFATFVRGCAMITRRIQDGDQSTIFNLSADPSQCPTKLSYSHGSSLLDFKLSASLADLLCRITEALDNAEGHMTRHQAECNFYHAIRATFLALQHSPAKGYAQFLSFYAVWFKMAEDSLHLHLTAGPVSDSAQLLWSYFIGLQLFIVLIVKQAAMEKGVSLLEEDSDLRNARISKLTATLGWFQAIAKNIPFGLMPFIKSPQGMAEEVTVVFNVPSPTEKEIQKKLEILRNLGLNAHTVLVSILDISATLTNWTEACLARMSRLETQPAFRNDSAGPITFSSDDHSLLSYEKALDQEWSRRASLEVASIDGHIGSISSDYVVPGSDDDYSALHEDLDILYRSDMLHLHSKLMD
ncbi:uncharacterized protein A1O9_03847 [Exophiala aquamarina CBS 119918]|uniref:Zn(2)-C6 fungal-type domain-containing protein n=1 Tax=Exophiala aquamarina CBS 119918 TaxID=1182545 RepID=A0A072PFV0_9EURO|nr:uncharacterized protein A1O9_03847 [Exophiala aquamarina CBS 119918]KEF59004.1 hypothetical protein A1O9_03847 [Exophiala aquamarina CBS 119918]